MIDQASIRIKSGAGGSGSISGRREKYVPRGGPDGGDGGTGGDVYVKCDPNLNTLLHFRHKRTFEATNGGDGAGRLKHGRNGTDVELAVPLGTHVWIGEQPPALLGDLTVAGQRVLVARGGKGGRGNARFASSTNRFPVLAESGEQGEELPVRLEVKLLADVGIVGLPNVGKSSLLAAVSGARPKIAAYPFTTLEPVLGVVEWRREVFVMVDIPGLVEGAHEGVGLGQDFLRHVERTRVLIHVVDGSAAEAAEEWRQTNRELHLFSEKLLTKPQIVAVNKVDIPEVRDRIGVLKRNLSGQGVAPHFISAVTREGLGPLFDDVLKELERVRLSDKVVGAAGPHELPVVRPRPLRERVEVQKENGTYIVSSPRVIRIAEMVDGRNWDGSTQFYGYLMRTGVVKALEEAGVLPGDTVRIGKVEWEWQ